VSTPQAPIRTTANGENSQTSEFATYIMIGLPIIWRLRTLALRLFLIGGHGLALAALALAVFGAIECIP